MVHIKKKKNGPHQKKKKKRMEEHTSVWGNKEKLTHKSHFIILSPLLIQH